MIQRLLTPTIDRFVVVQNRRPVELFLTSTEAFAFAFANRLGGSSVYCRRGTDHGDGHYCFQSDRPLTSRGVDQLYLDGTGD